MQQAFVSQVRNFVVQALSKCRFRWLHATNGFDERHDDLLRTD